MRIVTLLLLCGCTLSGQLTSDQKTIDMQDLAATYAKQYGPYEWKRDKVGFDLMNLTPWLSRAAATTNDLDFYEVMAEYVASLNDSHSLYVLPSTFSAGMGITVDLYDGKVLVDSINRRLLPVAAYPINIGDELVSVDGVAMQDLSTKYTQYQRYGTARATARHAANAVVNRSQATNPYAANVPATSALVFNQPAGLLTLTVPWVRSGLPLTSIDPVASLTQNRRKPAPGTTGFEEAAPDPAADAKDYLEQLRNAKIADPGPQGVLGFGAFTSIFNPPAGFAPRLGAKATDQFVSGTFPAGRYTFGYIRISSYSPSSSSTALAQFRSEMAYFQQNVDGLLIDQMRNPGGSVCYAQNIVASLMPAPFRAIGFEVRATRGALQNAYSSLLLAQLLASPQSEIDQYQLVFNNLQTAYSANRGRTPAMPLCGAGLTTQPATDATGAVISYTKPLVFLIDEYSASGGDAVAAMLQDNGRGVLVGYTTNGAGGSVGDGFNVGPYSEGTANVTLSLMVRKDTRDSPYGPTAYVENIGVTPDVTIDYMTRDNLLNGGRTFLNQVIAVLTQQVQKAQGQ